MSWSLVPRVKPCTPVAVNSTADCPKATLSSKEEDKVDEEVKMVTSSTSAVFVSAAVRRALGKATRSMHMKGGGSDYVYNAIGSPLKWPRAVRNDNKVYKFVQTDNVQVFATSSVAVATFSVFNFTLANLDQVASFQTLFDQYRIAKIEFATVPRMTGAPTATTNTALFASVIDYDDATALGTFEAATDYQSVLTSSGSDGHFRTFIPHCAIAAYSGTFVSYANVPAPWIDCASPGVIHYGIKTAWGITDSVYVMDALFRVTLEFRNVR
jgi:hypothetical protein